MKKKNLLDFAGTGKYALETDAIFNKIFKERYETKGRKSKHLYK